MSQNQRLQSSSEKKPTQAELKAHQQQAIRQKEQYFKQFNAHRNQMMPLVKFLKKSGLKFKHAKINQASVQYFRVDQLNQLVQQKKSIIQENSILSGALKSLPKDVIYFRRTRNQPRLKYPSMLQQAGDSGKFAAFKFDITESKRWLLVLIILAVFLGVLFPLWPFAVKYYLWLVSLYLLTGLLGIVAIRLLVYIVFGVLGFSFWILPNLFGDYGFFDSFKPFYSCSRWDKGICSLIFRLLALSFVGYYGYHIYLDPSFIFENFEISKVAFNDVHDWGVSKIKGQHGNFSQRALTNLDLIMNQTAQLNETNIDNDQIAFESQKKNTQN